MIKQKSRKISLILLIIFLIAISSLSYSRSVVKAEAGTTADGLNYFVNSKNEVVISSYGTVAGVPSADAIPIDIVIPNQIDGNDVTAISDYGGEDTSGGAGLWYRAVIIKSVILPNKLKTVGQYGLADCAASMKYTSLEFPETLESLHYYAVGNVQTLKTLKFKGNAPQFLHESGFDGVFTNVNLDVMYIYDTATGFDTNAWEKFAPITKKLPYLTADSCGGNGSSLTRNENFEIIKPQDPTKNKAVFQGWFIDEAKTIPLKFAGEENAYKLTKDEILTAYAKWDIDDGYTLTYDTKGGSVIEAKQIIDGKELIVPLAPTKDGFKFAGWYKDADCREIFAFDKMPNDHITIYAKWVETYEIENGRGEYNKDTPKNSNCSAMLKCNSTLFIGLIIIALFLIPKRIKRSR